MSSLGPSPQTDRSTKEPSATTWEMDMASATMEMVKLTRNRKFMKDFGKTEWDMDLERFESEIIGFLDTGKMINILEQSTLKFTIIEIW